jgi:signal transduction histidine kinase/BarA-like signal transduction histidine kinase
MRIRTQLVIMAACLVIPGLFAAMYAVEQVREGERQAALRGLQETVRATSFLVDREVQGSISAMASLATSPHFQSGNMEALYRQALAINQPPNVWTILLDETGRQVFNTAVPFGTPPPPPAARERILQVLESDKHIITDVVQGPVTKKLLTTIYVPGPTVGTKRYVLAQAFSVEHWKQKALQPTNRPGAIAAVIDRTGRFISRSHRTDELVGQRARPELVAAAAASQAGVIRHATLEGMDAYDAFMHSELTGWTIAVAAPVKSIEASALKAVAWLVLSFAAVGLFAVAAATFVARRFMTALDTAVSMAGAIGRGEKISPARTSVVEIDALHDSLKDASRLLAAERMARQVADDDRQRLLQQETIARQTAEQENKAKDQFIAMLGHELRNPLAAISGATAVLPQARTNVTLFERSVGIVNRQTRHLAHIVDDLLDTGRLLTGKIELAKVPVNLAEIAGSHVEALRASGRAHDRVIVSNFASAWVLGDSIRLEQVLSNLISNAIKYSPPGGTVQVVVHPVGGESLMEVTDFDAGISAEVMPHIFEPFFQGPGYAGSLQHGLGVGLALVKQLVELHGGTVEAQSDGLGTGSRFIVRLPRVEPPAIAASSGSQERSASGARILLVEDNDDARTSMATVLLMSGYDVVEANGGQQAVALAGQKAIDLVLLDIGLPDRNGYEVASDLRAVGSMEDVPIIAMTGYGQDRDRQRTREAGMQGHLVKPVELDTLFATIEGQLAR